MNKVTFHKMEIDGFKSISTDLTFEFDNYYGINMITGKNGAGKTTLLEAFYWCLYGKQLKEGVKLEGVRTKDKFTPNPYDGTRVIVEFTFNDIHYAIARHYKYKLLTFGRNGGDSLMIQKDFADVGELHKRDLQEFITNLFTIDHTVFLNSVLFGQRMVKFIDAPNESKRAILESLFNIAFVDKLKANAEIEFNKWDDRLTQEEHVELILSNDIMNRENELNRLAIIHSQFKLQQDKRIDDLKIRLNEKRGYLSTQINTKSGLGVIKDITDIGSETESLAEHIITVKNRIVDNKRKLKDIVITLDTGNCPKCLQPLKQFDRPYYERQKNELTSVIFEDDTGVREIILERDYLSKKLHKTVKNNEAIRTAIFRIELGEKDVNDVIDDIKIEESKELELIDFKTLKQELADSLDKRGKIRNDIVISAKHVERFLWWKTKGFSNTGLKSFMFNAMLNKLNLLIEGYSKRLGVLVKLSVDLTKARKSFIVECYKDGAFHDYEELSGGEKSRIDVMIAFSIHDLLSSSQNKFSVLFLDEFFEGLDEEGMFDAFDLLREKAKDTTVFVITHSQNIDVRNSKNIEVYKETGVSYIR